MKRTTVWLVAGLAIAALVPALAAEKKEREKGTLQAQRAGWMMGMYVGEEKGQPYPFVLQLDPDCDAKAKGVRTGDELIKVDKQETTPLNRLFDRVNGLRPGKEIEVWLRRGAQTLRLDVRVPKNPGAPDADQNAKSSKKKDDDQAGADGKKDDKKKGKNKGPVVIKPIPSTD